MPINESEVLSKFKYQIQEPDDNFEIEYEILPAVEKDKLNPRITEIEQKIAEIDAQAEKLDSKLNELNSDIEGLTNHADYLDYTISVSSGVLCGLIDSFFVGEFSLISEDRNWKSSEKINDFVLNVAKSQGYDGNDLGSAIEFLENKYHIPSDPMLASFGGGMQHHLRDFAHHPTPIGLLFSILTQFTKRCYGTNKAGAFIIVDVKKTDFIGENLSDKFIFGVINWVFHMVSDMAGSHNTPGAGTGLPGPIVSLLEEVSSLPLFHQSKNENESSKITEWVKKLFFKGRDENGKVKTFDLRAELSFLGEIGRQTIPIIINECFVRVFYFIHYFILECKSKQIHSFSELKKIEYKKCLPFKNRTVIRMMTIASGTFTAVDLADAAIHSAIEAGPPTTPVFWSKFVLRVNFVGIGRFAIAVGTDVGMGVKRQGLIKERMQLKSESDILQTAKLFYMQEGMWIEAVDTEKAMNDLCNTAEKSIIYFVESCNDISKSIENIGNYAADAEKNNPGLIGEMKDILTWG